MYTWPEQQARHLIDERIRNTAEATRVPRVRRGRGARRRVAGGLHKLADRLDHHEDPAPFAAR